MLSSLECQLDASYASLYLLLIGPDDVYSVVRWQKSTPKDRELLLFFLDDPHRTLSPKNTRLKFVQRLVVILVVAL